MPRSCRLTPRDREILRELERAPLLTRQIARLVRFSSAKKAAERLYTLHHAGLVKRVPYFHPGSQGKPEFLYCAKRARLHPQTLSHTVAVSEVRVLVAEWTNPMIRTSEPVSVDFYYGHELQTSSGLLPDAMLLLRKGDRRALVFLEVDNGTEPVMSGAGYSLERKLAKYAYYFDSGLYVRDFAVGLVRGFRVGLILPRGRRSAVARLVVRGHHDFVLITTFDLLENGLHTPIWRTYDGSDVDLLGRRGELTGEKGEPALPAGEGENP